MIDRTIGPQDDCVQCGFTKEEIRSSQRSGDPIPCEYEWGDDWREGYRSFNRHRFIWTAKDQKRAEQESLALDFKWLESL